MFTSHEKLVERISREIGFREISASRGIAAPHNFVGRAQTAIVEAYGMAGGEAGALGANRLTGLMDL